MNLRNSLISVSVASFLVGCGGGSSSGTTTTAPVVQKNSVICLDENKNTICDANETSEKVASWEDYGKTENKSVVSSRALDSTTGHPLAYNGEDGLVLTSPSGVKQISPWTTLVNNEITNNPNIKDLESAKNHLLSKLNLTEEPSATNQKSLEKLILKVLKEPANKNKNKNAILSSLSSKVIAKGAISEGALADVTVDEEDITSQGLSKLKSSELFSVNVDAEIDAQDADGWIDAKDSSIRTLSAKNGHLIGGSIYHNALTVVDMTAKTAKHNPFATIKGAGHGKLDAASGASENYLRAVEVTNDGETVYVNVPPKKSSSTTKDVNTYGLYKASVDNTGLVSYETATRVAEIFSSFKLSNDESTIIAYDSEGYLISYDKDLKEQKAEEISNINDYSISKDNKTLVTVFAEENNVNYVSKIDVETLVKDTVKIDLDFEADYVKYLDETKVLVANKHDMIVAVVDISLNKVLKKAELDMEADAISISPNGELLAVVGHHMNKIAIVNLGGEEIELQHDVELPDTSRAVAFLDDNTLAYTNGRNSIAVLKLEDTGLLVTLEEKLDRLLSKLNKSVNGGIHNAIIKDLTLDTKKGKMDIAWESSLPTMYLNTDTGAVTRPANDQADQAGTLTPTVSTLYRGENVSKSEVLNISIRKAPLILDAPKFVETGRADYMAVNADGSLAVSPIRFENTAGDEIYGIASFSIDTAGEITTKTAAKIYGDNEQIAGVGIYKDNAIGVTRTTFDDKYEGRLFTTKIVDGMLGDTVSSTLDIKTGTPQKVEWNSEQNKAAVLIQKEDKTFITEVYTIDDMGVAVLSESINMGAYEYKTYGPPAINDDGTKVYQRDGDNVIGYTKDGQIALKKVDDIARVWYGASRVFVFNYSGGIHSFNENLEDEKVFSTGTGGRMYGGEIRTVDGTNYLILPVQRSSAEYNGIYKLEILADGSLKEIAFSNQPEGADRMAVSKDGKTVVFSFTKDKKRQMGALRL